MNKYMNLKINKVSRDLMTPLGMHKVIQFHRTVFPGKYSNTNLWLRASLVKMWQRKLLCSVNKVPKLNKEVVRPYKIISAALKCYKGAN